MTNPLYYLTELSACCTALTDSDVMICSACGEHCELLPTDEADLEDRFLVIPENDQESSSATF